MILEGMVGGKYFRKTLENQEYGVGRGSHNEIHLVHRSVSRDHARLIFSSGGFVVEDGGSRNGTFVNEIKVMESVAFGPGDQIRFGGIELAVLEAGAPLDPVKVIPKMSQEDASLSQTRLSWDDLTQSGGTDQVSVLFQTMSEAAPLLVQPRPLNEVFEAILDLIERFVPARRILLMLQNESGDLEFEAGRPNRESDDEELILSQSMLNTVLEDRSALLVSDAQSDERYKLQQSIVAFDVRSALIAPLVDDEQVTGLIYADNNDPLVQYDEKQLQGFALLANFVAIKITQTKLLSEQREKERLVEEMETASRIQKALLPTTLPAVKDYAIYAHQTPCFETAGDLYDVESLPNGDLILIVGDVSGKGLGAAMLTSNIIASLRILYHQDLELGEIASRLNDQVHRSTEMSQFVTLFIGRLETATGKLSYVNCGHNPAYLILEDGIPETLDATGVPCGMMPGVEYGVDSMMLPRDSVLCIYTDGIPEASRDGEFYDEERMIQSLQTRFTLPIDESGEGVLTDLYEFVGHTNVDDDITLFLLRRQQEDPTASSTSVL